MFLVTKVAVTLAFFGYARQGAAVFPVIALLVALAAWRWTPALGAWGPWQVLRAATLVLAASVAVETARALHPPTLRLDGQSIEAGDPVPLDLHRDDRID